ncbi:hypothetical protein DKP78_25470, partial [Enterococcus faecium]
YFFPAPYKRCAGLSPGYPRSASRSLPSPSPSPSPQREMGFVSFAGRVLFASVFLLSAYQEFSEFGADGGPAAKALRPK